MCADQFPGNMVWYVQGQNLPLATALRRCPVDISAAVLAADADLSCTVEVRLAAPVDPFPPLFPPSI